jgi:YcaO-like protein with predicted kinase domain
MKVDHYKETVPKLFRNGTVRCVSPTETLNRVRPFFPIMGITRVANVTGLDSIGIPVVMVSRPNSRALAVAQGKGLDLPCAKASGVMESIEQYHAEHIHLPLVLGTYDELCYTYNIVDVEGLPKTKGTLFHNSFRLLWLEGFDLLQSEEVWVPYEVVHADFTLPLPTGSGCFIPSSNGLASGNVPLEAVIHGICELLERDATSIWDLLSPDEQQKSRLDLESVSDPDCVSVLQAFERASIAVGVWVTTSDVGIPSFTCYIVDAIENPLRQLYATAGHGCHPTRGIALLRALLEAAQSRLTLISGSRDDTLRTTYELNRSRRVVNTLRSHIRSGPPQIQFSSVPTFDGQYFNDDLVWILERLENVAIEQVVVVNLSKPEFEIPVVRVIIPGLEGSNHSPGYIPGERARRIIARNA